MNYHPGISLPGSALEVDVMKSRHAPGLWQYNIREVSVGTASALLATGTLDLPSPLDPTPTQVARAAAILEGIY